MHKITLVSRQMKEHCMLEFTAQRSCGYRPAYRWLVTETQQGEAA